MNEEYEDDFEQQRDKLKKSPLFVKANEIAGVAHNLGFVFDELIEQIEDEFDKELAKHYVNEMRSNGLLIPAKVAASSVELYDLRMENAALIRRAAREMQTHCTALKHLNLGLDDYLNLLRDELEAFRVLFAEWVKTFDPNNYIIDRWGLFNPPGVSYDDFDPDDFPRDTDDE